MNIEELERLDEIKVTAAKLRKALTSYTIKNGAKQKSAEHKKMSDGLDAIYDVAIYDVAFYAIELFFAQNLNSEAKARIERKLQRSTEKYQELVGKGVKPGDYLISAANEVKRCLDN